MTPLTNPTEDPNATRDATEERTQQRADMPRAEGVESGATPPQPKRKRPAWQWTILLIAIGLLAIGLAITAWLQRERLLKLLPSWRSDQASVSGKRDREGGSQVRADMPEGAFQITPEKQQLIGVQFGEAQYKPVSKPLRTVGRLAYDETTVTRIHAKVEGWIEQVYVDFTGKLVRKGQPLISIYSPELLQTQQEFLLARRGRAELSRSPFREAVTGAASLYEAARKRLELWDISQAQIRELERSGKPVKALTLYAPADGFVLARSAFPKQRITPETELYAIADLSTIWVLADIYEYEAPEIKVSQPVKITLAYFPGRIYRGRVAYIYPQLDNTTRTLKVRIELPNPGFALKPDMFANVEAEIYYGQHIVVPEEAVMDSGAEQLVFVAHEGGYFEPRKVKLGAKVDNEFIVLSGLKAGERVVTSANFLIDSESKLKAAAGGMGMPGMSRGGAPAGGKPSPQTGPEDHSQHQQMQTPQAKPQKKTTDHSGHQP